MLDRILSKGTLAFSVIFSTMIRSLIFNQSKSSYCLNRITSVISEQFQLFPKSFVAFGGEVQNAFIRIQFSFLLVKL